MKNRASCILTCIFIQTRGEKWSLVHSSMHSNSSQYHNQDHDGAIKILF